MKATDAIIFNPALRSAQPLACRLFEAACARGKIANAYLLTGCAYDDKLALVRQLACHFNCQSKNAERDACLLAFADPALYCLNCQWIYRGEHPQAWLALEGEGKSGKVPVEKARQLTDELSKTSPYARVVLVPQASEATFHRPAANALLKCIEEPPADVLFAFLAETPDDVLATIVSRCQVVPFAKAMVAGHSFGDAQLLPEAKAKLAAARSDFMVSSRRHLAAPAVSNQYFKTVTEALALSRQMQELCKDLQEVVEEREAAEQILDLFVAAELAVLQEGQGDSEEYVRYMQKLIALGERSKRQINQYVKSNNAIESFSLSLIDLRQAFSGERNLAKR